MALAEISSTAAIQALNGLDASGTPTNVLAYVSLHTANPGTSGAGEYAGVTRQACTWNAASGTTTVTKTNSSSLTFTTSGATAVTYAGTFSAVTAGTYGIGLALTSSVTATTITVASGALTITGTG